MTAPCHGAAQENYEYKQSQAMNEGLIPKRYAKALYKVSEERHDSEQIYRLMDVLNRTFASTPQLQRAVANPFVADGDKLSLILTAAGLPKDACDTSSKGNAAAADGKDMTAGEDEAEAKAGCGTFTDFVKLLEKNRRIDIIWHAAQAYLAIYRIERRIRKVTVTSATPLEDNLRERILRIVRKETGDDTLETSFETDPSLIGGFTVDIDNRRLDASLLNELKQLRLNLIGQR